MPYKNNIQYRKEKLIQLLHAIESHEESIIEALYQDLKKPAYEAVITETAYIVNELRDTIKNIRKWAKPKRVWPSLLNFPSTDRIYKEPYGKVLIIAPWNYPFQLAFSPLIAAVAAGNQVVLKPSEISFNTSQIISKIIQECFENTHVCCVEGGVDKAEELLKERWDYIFFTGSVAVGHKIAQAAAQNLTPVTLELGGKSPCIVDESADLPLAAKRIVWGKFLNAGQTCIAPDYLVIHHSIKMHFIELLQKEITAFYGNNPEKSPDFARIINSKNWNRLTTYLKGVNIVIGGERNLEDLYIAPTVVLDPDWNSLIMNEEIFGPLLPVIGYESESEIDDIIKKHANPLAFYVFTKNKSFAQDLIQKHSFGGGCINDTLIHFTNKNLPFGGIEKSGMGAYHGKLSFDLFTHFKPVISKGNWLDIPIRYAPYKSNIDWIKKLLKWMP
jgi:aldehyde dehydrogenase (NAD+)